MDWQCDISVRGGNVQSGSLESFAKHQLIVGRICHVVKYWIPQVGLTGARPGLGAPAQR